MKSFKFKLGYYFFRVDFFFLHKHTKLSIMVIIKKIFLPIISSCYDEGLNLIWHCYCQISNLSQKKQQPNSPTCFLIYKLNQLLLQHSFFIFVILQCYPGEKLMEGVCVWGKRQRVDLKYFNGLIKFIYWSYTFLESF